MIASKPFERRPRGAFCDDPSHASSGTASLDGGAGRHRRARFRRPPPPADGDEGHAWAGIPARSGNCGRLTRWRRAGARRWSAHRGGGRARAVARDQSGRPAAPDPAGLASGQPPSADADHAERPAYPARSRDRGDGQGTWCAGRRNRGAVRSRRRGLFRRAGTCARGSWAGASRPGSCARSRSSSRS